MNYEKLSWVDQQMARENQCEKLYVSMQCSNRIWETVCTKAMTVVKRTVWILESTNISMEDKSKSDIQSKTAAAFTWTFSLVNWITESKEVKILHWNDTSFDTNFLSHKCLHSSFHADVYAWKKHSLNVMSIPHSHAHPF